MSHPRFASVLPDELFWEILSWVPAKALMQLRYVCKSWNSIIFDPTFVKLHLERSSRKPLILCKLFDHFTCKYSLHCSSIENLLDDISCTIHDGSFPFMYDITGVCNGLVCLTITTNHYATCNIWVVFWNPATRLRSKISCIITSQKVLYPLHENMGFGYDDSSDTYKVVAVLMRKESWETEVRVHCLGDHCSRKVLSWNGFPKLQKGNGQYLNGTLNWIAEIDTSNQCVIFSFDLRNETYKYLFLPSSINSFTQYIGVLKGCLCHFQYKKRTIVTVWQMKEFGIIKSWTPLLNVSSEHLQNLNPFYWQFPLFMSGNGNYFLLEDDRAKSQFNVYKHRDNRIEKIQCLTDVYLLDYFDYFESLVLPY